LARKAEILGVNGGWEFFFVPKHFEFVSKEMNYSIPTVPTEESCSSVERFK
jgi:hypothetical protein